MLSTSTPAEERTVSGSIFFRRLVADLLGDDSDGPFGRLQGVVLAAGSLMVEEGPR